VLDGAVETGQQTQNDRRSGQLNMFGAASSSGSAAKAATSTLPDVPEFKSAELLKFEKDLLGFYITSHPLTEHQLALERYTTASTREAMSCGEGTEVTIGAMISRVKKVVTKNGRSAGQQMAILTLEDLEGQIDATLFAETFEAVNQKYPTAIANESIVFVKGKVDKKRETPSILVNEVIPIAEAMAKLTTSMLVKFDPTRHAADVVQQTMPLFKQHRGNLPVYVQVPAAAGQMVTLRLPSDLSVKPMQALAEELERLLGTGCVQFHGGGTRRQKKLAQQQLFKEAALELPVESSVPDDLAMAAAMDADAAREEEMVV
jgi:DNA polymerase-3 subunit alpha